MRRKATRDGKGERRGESGGSIRGNYSEVVETVCSAGNPILVIGRETKSPSLSVVRTVAYLMEIMHSVSGGKFPTFNLNRQLFLSSNCREMTISK